MVPLPPPKKTKTNVFLKPPFGVPLKLNTGSKSVHNCVSYYFLKWCNTCLMNSLAARALNWKGKLGVKFNLAAGYIDLV